QGVAATSLSEINTSTLNALQDRATTARTWRNYTPLPDVTPQLLIEEPQEIRGVKLNQSVNFAVTVLFVILAALVVRFAALLSHEGLTTGNMLGAGIPLIIIVVNYRIISDIVQTVRTSASPTAPFVAMFRALEDNAGNLGRAFALPFTHQLRIHSITWVKGESEKIEVTISDRETADCSQILATMNEVLAPPSPSTRWVLEAGRADFTVGRSLVWLATLFFSRSAPQYFAVPDALTRPEEAEQFAQSWRELVGPCRLKEAPEVLTGSAPLAARLRELA
ncbi:MAG: hypothetical protein ACTH1Z_08765, partial [Ancrocorticia sp.]|uniref:hypothetical protein n=1 Tax=Ancrocorticia sp. TaxID=2593684 RepID=UPI003F8EE676